MYRMPKKRPTKVRNHLQFQVPLIRLVIPLDSLAGKLRASSPMTLPNLHLETLRQIIRIETPFEELLPNVKRALRPPPPAPRVKETSTKKTNPMRKISLARSRPRSSRSKKK